MTEPKARSKTAEEILDVAEMLIQTRGYSASSYQDISQVLGIRKASIHYHFPSKTDLGVAVIERYAERFRSRTRCDRTGQRPEFGAGYAGVLHAALSGVRRHARPGLSVRGARR